MKVYLSKVLSSYVLAKYVFNYFKLKVYLQIIYVSSYMFQGQSL